ncbi:MAG: PAS domain-containing sensor histidine kinase [Candidatus Accumulibacter sp.]|jgi:two-component system sensor histidine kinase PilS (NtrC family)|nr:PAS domain-containing sensor histidine kinase [Accumulibacter sp.]
MPDATSANASPISPTHWKALRYFGIYRLCVAALLVPPLFFQSPFSSLIGQGRISLQSVVVCFYFLANAASLAALHFHRRRFNRQLGIQVLLDVLILTWLFHTKEELRDSLGTLLLVTVTGAGLVGQGRLVLLYAAMATLAVLAEGYWRAWGSARGATDFFQTGLFCASFFAVAISARMLARRVIVNEELARRRGEALRNQTIISQRVIEEMQDGVLVLDRKGLVKQHNPRVERLLGLGNPERRMLATYSTELAVGFQNWRARGGDEPVMIRAPASGIPLRARFIDTASSEGDVLVLLEDIGRLQERAKQIKLAALGRLTASIAHEIRNPLSAIKHAGELMREESAGPTSDRLLRIVLDNAQRVERIVSDVLGLGQRDRIQREFIDLRQALPLFVEEFVIKEEVPAGVVQVEISGRAILLFDRAHLHQILWNLVGNALRYSRRVAGSVRLCTQDRDRHVDLHVIDDGEGVDEAHREQIFEPFFTTHSRGTGLGLYIARELCDANGASLELLDSQGGADFCIAGRSTE